MREILGIDVGATGIKGAIVDIKKGILITDRIKYPTPKPATPENMVVVMKQIVADLNWKGKPIGMGFPAIVKNGVVLSASNIDEKWVNFPIAEYLTTKLKSPINVINDADAAGIAEMEFGGHIDQSGLIILLTLGTGIGSAVFLDGNLLSNTEFGQIYYKDSIAEKYASNGAREIKDLSWKSWGKELNKVIKHIEKILSPDKIFIGGGVSRKFDKYAEYLKTSAPIEPAKLLNNAGIVGAAMAAPTSY
ncbi:MAG: ROK family protein [Saprospiraceae bacterium]